MASHVNIGNRLLVSVAATIRPGLAAAVMKAGARPFCR
jgi:hypothetical protein